MRSPWILGAGPTSNDWCPYKRRGDTPSSEGHVERRRGLGWPGRRQGLPGATSSWRELGPVDTGFLTSGLCNCGKWRSPGGWGLPWLWQRSEESPLSFTQHTLAQCLLSGTVLGAGDVDVRRQTGQVQHWPGKCVYWIRNGVFLGRRAGSVSAACDSISGL